MDDKPDSSLYRCADPILYGLLKQYARENRKHMTDAEDVLWSAIKGLQLGVKFHRQYIIKEYIVDFVCLECNLIIEVDGAYHLEPQQAEDDEVRQSNLENIGFTVLRFTNDQVLYETDSVLEKIGQAINS
jgi:ATP-dependent DNA helicase RecG